MACELIKPLVKPNGLVVGVQSGMTMEDVASIVGPERTLGAVIEVTSNMFQPGIVVRQTPPSGSWFGIGAFDASTRGRENEVGQCLRHAGTVEITDDIRSAKWMKLVVNAAVDVKPAKFRFPDHGAWWRTQSGGVQRKFVKPFKCSGKARTGFQSESLQKRRCTGIQQHLKFLALHHQRGLVSRRALDERDPIVKIIGYKSFEGWPPKVH